jgi:hypothetical protein
MTIFTMLFIEMMAARFDVFGNHDHATAAADRIKEDPEKHGKFILCQILWACRHRFLPCVVLEHRPHEVSLDGMKTFN